MRNAEDWHQERLRRTDCFNPDWIREIQREAFDAGADAALNEAITQIEFESNSLTDAVTDINWIDSKNLKGRP